MTDTLGIVAAAYVMLVSLMHAVATRKRKEVDVNRFRIVLAMAFAMALLYLVK